MADILGWRGKFGVVTPSPNTVVQPEYDAMRPVGITNHLARMHIEVPPVAGDAAFRELVRLIDQALEPALDRVMSAAPDHVILGVSVEAVWEGLAGAERVRQRIRARTGDRPCTTAAEAVPAALAAVGAGGRIATISPYTESGNEAVVRFFAECGIEVVRAIPIHREGPPKRFSRLTEEEVRQALIAADGPDVSAVVQFGANVAMARLAAEAELWLDKPVIAVNTATYWHALRSHGIPDKVAGFGTLLERH